MQIQLAYDEIMSNTVTISVHDRQRLASRQPFASPTWTMTVKVDEPRKHFGCITLKETVHHFDPRWGHSRRAAECRLKLGRDDYDVLQAHLVNSNNDLEVLLRLRPGYSFSVNTKRPNPYDDLQRDIDSFVLLRQWEQQGVLASKRMIKITIPDVARVDEAGNVPFSMDLLLGCLTGEDRSSGLRLSLGFEQKTPQGKAEELGGIMKENMKPGLRNEAAAVKASLREAFVNEINGSGLSGFLLVLRQHRQSVLGTVWLDALAILVLNSVVTSRDDGNRWLGYATALEDIVKWE